MEWYSLIEQERIKQVYSKYSIADFWDWWSNKEKVWMEIRTVDWKFARDVGTRLKIPYAPSGVFVDNAVDLKRVIAMSRNKNNVWFSINPRKKNYNKKGWKSFGGGDCFIDSINYVFIDIDRFTKSKKATKEELKNCDKLADKILERFGKQDWNKNYIKIASGNGVQLLIKLDIPIKMPMLIFDNETKIYQPNNEFETIKKLIKDGIGRQIIKFCKQFRTELKVEVDASAFFIGRVGALHCTKNYKYDGFSWRGVIDMKDGDNVGLSDYILSAVDDKDRFKNQNVFISSTLMKDDIIRPGRLRQNKLVKLMLSNKLPHGGINNKIWFSLKILLRDSKFDLTSDEFRQVHKELEKIYGNVLTLNFPHEKFKFNKTTVNNFSIEFGLPLIYELWPNKTKKLNMRLDNIEWGMQNLYDDKIELSNNTNVFEDMIVIKDMLKENSPDNLIVVGKFINGCVKKYGEEKTKYYVVNKIFYKFFTYV